MQNFGEAPLTRAELEEHCRCALATARHACAELAEDLNEASDADLINRVFMARVLIEDAMPVLLPREQNRAKAGTALWGGIPEADRKDAGRGTGAFLAWLLGYRRVTRVDTTPPRA